MIETVVGLLMFINGEIKEHRIQENMATCLRGKRVAERDYNPSVSYKCIKSKAEKVSKKLFLNKLKRLNLFANYLRDRRFHQRVVKDKKKYDRKKLINFTDY